MHVGRNIWIGCLMIQLASSCMHDVKDDIKIEWGAVDLPADSVGQPHLGLAGPLVGSVGSKVIIGGGANFPDGKPWEGGHKKYHGDVFVYTWHNQILTYHHTDQLPSPLAYAACYSDNDKIYVVGGENEAGLSKGAYAIGIGADEDLVIDTLPNLPEGISSAGLVCVGHVLYLVGGETEKFTSDQILRLDSKGSNTWENVQQLPHGISNAVVVAVGKDLYIMGGRYRVANEISPFSDRVYLFDTQENTISSLTSLPEPLAAAVGIRYKGVIFFLGGDNAQTYHQVEELLLQAATEQDMTRKDSITQRKNRLQANHPGFSKKQLVYDIGAETWKALEADFPFDMPVTTTAVRLDSNFLMIPSGEIKAGVRTDKIYIGKIIKD